MERLILLYIPIIDRFQQDPGDHRQDVMVVLHASWGIQLLMRVSFFLDLLNKDVGSDHDPLYRGYLAVGQKKKAETVRTSVNFETGTTTGQLIVFSLKDPKLN